MISVLEDERPVPLATRVQNAYQEARQRPGAPYQMLDGEFNTLRARWGAILGRVGAPANGLSALEAEKQIAELMEKGLAFFAHWQGMSENDTRQAAYILANPAPPPENVELSARNLVDSLRELGVRFDVGTKGALSLSPARLVPERDRANITRLKAAIVAEVERRADVWHV